ncbi:Stealth protein CR2, conserved region 2 [Shimia gijangensis]|uniref:Stealth protein CR2, conserved region 2 n=1 Tax=Shimia gijangensis TaxID=1470563 RepID=A0A1M6CF21_9RHOB|nr:hypothetical protein [Shimia gijangensis]SHI59523.1 Stealth protein CR2, conserved region 2 [Shimia gijangensis]
MSQLAEPIDLVYTWVDDSFPGYQETLNDYVSDKHDSNPNRTRDNLDIIRYSLRSTAKNLKGIRRIYFVSCRPQVPAWLNVDHPQIEVVHHDQIMSQDILPTFNSFCIVSHLHLLPGISRRFLYIEDDMLVMSPDLLPALFAPDGMPYAHFKPLQVQTLDKLDPVKSSPWNLSLATANQALSQRFGSEPRNHIIHGPQIMDTESCEAMCRNYAELIDKTRHSRFRAGDNVPPEWLSRHLAVEIGAAVKADWSLSRKIQGYVSLENFAPWTWWQLKWVNRRKPLSITLNDSFESTPNPRVEAMVRTQLEQWFPEPSPFEIEDSV